MLSKNVLDMLSTKITRKVSEGKKLSLDYLKSKGFTELTEDEMREISSYNPDCKVFDWSLSQAEICGCHEIIGGLSLSNMIRYDGSCACAECKGMKDFSCLVGIDLCALKRQLKAFGGKDEAKDIEYYLGRLGREVVLHFFGGGDSE